MKNYYDLLEVNPKASTEIIEKAYKVLVKKYHPDLYQGEEKIYAEAKTRELNEAYRVLSNEFLREQYDLELEKENRFNEENNSINRNKLKEQITNNQTEDKEENEEQEEKEQKPHKVGTIMSIVDIVKEIFKRRNKKGEKREINKEDKLAAIITLVIVIVLGIALWFIPATNGFMRSLIPF